MKTYFLASVLLWSAALPAIAQDQVTIPKSRLQELEQKEAELEKLKKPQAPPTTTVPRSSDSNTAPSAALPPPAAITTLGPIRDGDTVDAEHLAAYYLQDPSSAQDRFRKVRIFVRGEIVSFNKPAFRRDYRILLRGSAPDNKVVCDLTPPDRFKAVFTTNEGNQLVGLQGETRVPLAKVGDRVVVEGKVKGQRKSNVSFVGKKFDLAR